MERDDDLPLASPAPSVADAAAASSAETAEAIDRAAAVNDDPVVGGILEEAAIAADQTTSRVGWLRGFLHRLFSRTDRRL